MIYSLRKSLKAKIRRNLLIIILVVIIALILALPLFAGTKSYPVTVVDGNSMYPKLQNGDVVYFTHINANQIPNGTIIVFSQDQSGLLGGLIPPVVIHRVIDEVIQPDGSITYVTKGDNNNFQDPNPVTPNQVLGAATLVIPKVGLVFQFVKSAQGLVAIVGLIVIVYIVAYDTRWTRDKRKELLLGNIAQKTVNGEFPEALFRKFELVLKYGDGMDTKGISDPEVLAIADWVKNGAIDHDWRIESTKCGKCSGVLIRLVNRKGRPLELCRYCLSNEKQNSASPSN